MSCKEYLSELLSIQCEHAYGTVRRLEDTGALSDADKALLARAQDMLMQLRDRFRVVKNENENKETGDGKQE